MLGGFFSILAATTPGDEVLLACGVVSDADGGKEEGGRRGGGQMERLTKVVRRALGGADNLNKSRSSYRVAIEWLAIEWLAIEWHGGLTFLIWL